MKNETIFTTEIIKYMNLIESDREFNTYKISGKNITEIQTVSKFGILIFYVEPDNKQLVKEKIDELTIEAKEQCYDVAVHRLDKYIPFGRVEEKIPMRERICKFRSYDFYNFILNVSKKNTQDKEFIWYITMIDRNENFSYLRYQKKRTDVGYYLSSPSTIIYDTCDLFRDEVKQLDYPYLTQYNFNILDTPIYIVDVYDNKENKSRAGKSSVIMNIIMSYMEHYKKYLDKFILCDHILYIENIKKNYSVITNRYSKFKEIKMYDCEEKCFISGAPLLDYFICYEILCEGQIKFIYINHMFDDEGSSLLRIIKYKDNWLSTFPAIQSIFKIKYKKNIELVKKYTCYKDNIEDEIKKLSKSYDYKNLLLSISRNYEMEYRSVVTNSRIPNTVYSVNEVTNQVFIGHNFITDNIILKYQNQFKLSSLYKSVFYLIHQL